MAESRDKSVEKMQPQLWCPVMEGCTLIRGAYWRWYNAW